MLLGALVRGESLPIDSELTIGLMNLGGQASLQLIGRWRDLSQASRSVVLSKLGQNESGGMEILDAVRKGNIAPADIDAITIQRLRADGSQQVSKGAIEIFGPAPGADRPALVRQALLGWPKKADASIGQVAYRKHCAACHEGRKVDENYQESLAPNLRGLAHWTNEAWAIAILDPNRSVEEKYWVFQARTHEGQVLTGLKLREDESSIEWVDSNGRIENLNKADIAEFRESERSLMPEGFEQLLSPEEIAGIISYLRSSGPTKGE